MNVRETLHGRFTDLTRSLYQGKKFRIAPVPHVIMGRPHKDSMGWIGSMISGNGGNVTTLQTHSTAVGHTKTDHSSDGQKLTVTKISTFHNQEKKKQHAATKDIKNQMPTSRISQPFTDIFGTPIKTKPSPEQIVKSKENNTGVSNNQKISSGLIKPIKTPTNSHSSGSSQHTGKVGRPPKDKTLLEKEIKEPKQSKGTKHSEKESKHSGSKRHSSPVNVQNTEGPPNKKRHRNVSTSSDNNSVPFPEGDKKGDPSKLKCKEARIKDKHKSKSSNPNDDDHTNKIIIKKEKTKEKALKHKKLINESNKSISPMNHGNQKVFNKEKEGSSSDQCKIESEVENKDNIESIIPEDENSSPTSSISLSSLPPGGSHGPLATMMAEMEKDLLSPLSSDPDSPPAMSPDREKVDLNHTVDNVTDSPHDSCKKSIREEPEETDVKVRKDDSECNVKKKKEEIEQPVKIKKEKESSSKLKKEGEQHISKPRKENMSKHSSKKEKNSDSVEQNNKDKKSFSIEPAYLDELKTLQSQIMATRDRQLLQKVVDLIEETGLYNISTSSFDFDLCLLDQTTVRKLQSCLTVK